MRRIGIAVWVLLVSIIDQGEEIDRDDKSA